MVDWRFVAGCLTLEHRLPRIETRSVLRCGVRASDFRCWHETDMAGLVGDVWSRGYNGSRVSDPSLPSLTLAV